MTACSTKKFLKNALPKWKSVTPLIRHSMKSHYYLCPTYRSQKAFDLIYYSTYLSFLRVMKQVSFYSP